MREDEIRPKNLYDKLLQLVAEDVDEYFSTAKLEQITCPACGGHGTFVFNKNGFSFEECGVCDTLYVSPRPSLEAFETYYRNSKASEFWATTFYKETESNRRELLWKPKALMILNKINNYYPNTETIIDIGGGYGVFMEEFMKVHPIKHIIIEPSSALASVCNAKGFNVVQNFLEKVTNKDIGTGKKTFVSFELFEHLHSPLEFLTKVHSLMDNDDIFIFTTLSGKGLDIRVLWDKAKAVSPPMHLNFLNPSSIQILVEKIGFEVLEVSTPGKLDINILENNHNSIKDRFWRMFVKSATIQEKSAMQDYISNNNLSSHMMIIVRRKI